MNAEMRRVAHCANCKRPFVDGQKVFEFVIGREGKGGPTFTFCEQCKDVMLEDVEVGNATPKGEA